ncbi:hypothetical protein GmHk_14G041284 [Glycine max]|nr:hypothetical protein GmHk_14G041284 [Glycine max]
MARVIDPSRLAITPNCHPHDLVRPSRPRRIPMIIVETHVTYHIPFEHTPQCYTNHRPNNPLWFRRHFFEHDANGKATRSTFCQDTTVEVYKDVGDFVNDEDLTPFEIAFY